MYVAGATMIIFFTNISVFRGCDVTTTLCIQGCDVTDPDNQCLFRLLRSRSSPNIQCGCDVTIPKNTDIGKIDT